MNVTLDTLIQAWKATPACHRFFPAADEEQIAAAESALGVRLPQIFRELYRFSNGLSLDDGQLTIHPLTSRDDGGSLVSMSDQLRRWRWPVPGEVLVFGANGGGEPYGLWIGPHDNKRFPEPIVQIGEIFEPASMGLYSTRLLPLLLHDTIFGLVFKREYEILFRHFGLGQELLPNPDLLLQLSQPATDESEQQRRLEAVSRCNNLEKWVDPDAMLQYNDPYKARLDREAMASILS